MLVRARRTVADQLSLSRSGKAVDDNRLQLRCRCPDWNRKIGRGRYDAVVVNMVLAPHFSLSSFQATLFFSPSRYGQVKGAQLLALGRMHDSGEAALFFYFLEIEVQVQFQPGVLWGQFPLFRGPMGSECGD